MDRRLITHLRAWKQREKRKPLLLMGARQVGKTYLLRQFGKEEFPHCIYLNFEDTPSLKQLFEESLKPATILRNLEIETGEEIRPRETLLIFDEIQECPAALNSLKYFCEEAPEIPLAAAGSLLGVKLMHTKGFPVGKVDFLHLFPLGFFEFLQAMGENRLYQVLEDHATPTPLPPFLHEKALALFKTYLFVGGMPEAVAEYARSENVFRVREIHEAILRAYSLDFAKHAPSDQLMKISQVWEGVPSQLAKENKKFIYSALRKGARAREFEGALQWLVEAGMVHKVHNVSTPRLPLGAYAKPEFFKIYLLDTGLLAALSGLSPKALLEGNALFQEFRGSLMENFVAQELSRSGYGLYYWTSEGKAEVDFLLQHEEAIFPLEVNSGNSGKKKSLLSYDAHYNPGLLLRTSPMNLTLDGKVLNSPLYLLSRLGRLVG